MCSRSSLVVARDAGERLRAPCLAGAVDPGARRGDEVPVDEPLALERRPAHEEEAARAADDELERRPGASTSIRCRPKTSGLVARSPSSPKATSRCGCGATSKSAPASIINLSSVAGSRGSPNAAVYVASKHAVEGLTKSAAIEAAPFGVRVNAVAPGPIETNMLSRFTGDAAGMAEMIERVPLERAGTADEIARAILFVASDAVPFLTGQALVVDGGQSIAFGGGEAAVAHRVKRAA
jgi:hypothetical protein